MPPRPAVLASAAARRRRDRSFRSSATAANRSRIADVSIIARLYEGKDRAGISLVKNPGGVTSLDLIDFLITRLRQLENASRTKQEHADLQGVRRWRAIGSNSKKASARPLSTKPTEPKSNAMRRLSHGVGRTASSVRIAAAGSIASSGAERGDCSSVTPAASRRPSGRERFSPRASCRCASGSRRSIRSRNPKAGISNLELARRLGLTQTAAWMMKHKLVQVMLERNASKRLTGKVQMDDAYIGGAHSGRRGRGAEGNTWFVAAVATTDDGKPDQIILRRVKAFSKVGDPKPFYHGDPRRGRGRLRWIGLFPSRHGGRLRSRGHQNWQWSESRKDASLQMGQHRARQHEGRVGWNISRRPGKNTCPAISPNSNTASIAGMTSKP